MGQYRAQQTGPTTFDLGIYSAGLEKARDLTQAYADNIAKECAKHKLRREQADTLLSTARRQVTAYENALRQRARLLGEGNRDPHWFTALEDTMARHGVAVAAARRTCAGMSAWYAPSNRRGKKKSTRLMRPIEKVARSLADASNAATSTYLKRHKKSNRKRRDGWVRDTPSNVFEAGRKALKKIRPAQFLGL